MNPIEALRLCQRLFDEALPKFNWGASALDANAIDLLNRVPAEVARVLASYESDYVVMSREEYDDLLFQIPHVDSSVDQAWFEERERAQREESEK